MTIGAADLNLRLFSYVGFEFLLHSLCLAIRVFFHVFRELYFYYDRPLVAGLSKAGLVFTY